MEKEKVTAKDIIKRHDRLKSDRAVWESHWQEVVDYVLPNRAGFMCTTVPGEKRMQKIFDGTAPWATEQLAAALHGMLTNPAQRWFSLRTKNRKLMDNPEVAIWLEEAEDAIYDVFSSPEANFNSQIHELYLDLAGFGTAIMLVEETPGEGVGVQYRTWFLGECVVSENARGMIDTIYRKFQWSARKIVQKWGQGEDKVGKKVSEAYTKDPEKLFWIVHEVCPRVERDPSRMDPKNKPFSSTYVLVEEERILSESGMDRFRFLVPRWSKMAGENYGRSPSMTALPDIKMLNEMCKTTLKAAQKVVDPPLLVPDDGFILPIRTTPAGLNFFRTGLGDNSMIKPLETKGNIGLGLDMEDRRREAILRAYYQDRLKLQKEKIEMTRAETIIRDQENLRMMSPTAGRLETELLNEAVGLTFETKMKQGAFREPPEALVGQTLEVAYASPIARAQRASEGEALSRAMVLLGPMGQIDPQIYDNFDGDMIARATRDWYGIPAKLMKSPAKVDQIRQGRAERAAAEQEKIDAERTAAVQANTAKAQAVAA